MGRLRLGVLGFTAALALCSVGLTATASGATFNADPASLGTAPDDGTLTPLNVTFDVNGFSGAPTDVALTVTGSNTFVSDVNVRLVAPDGTSFPIFSFTGAPFGSPQGYNSNWIGTYTYSDSAPASPTFWEAAAVNGSTTIPNGAYRASVPGQLQNAGANTLITPAFAGLSNPNGTWTMAVRDNDTGNDITISGASLAITAAAPAAPSLTSTDPASPATSTTPKVKGTALAGTQVKLYSSAACTGAPLATGTPAELAGAGIAVTVPANATTQLRATATNADNQVSACSAPLSYTTPIPTVDPPVNPPDTTAPETSFRRQPTRTGPEHSHFAFRSSEPGSTFRCSLDKAAFRSCKSPKDYRNLDKGKHVFRVAAVDSSGNVDPTPARLKFRIGS